MHRKVELVMLLLLLAGLVTVSRNMEKYVSGEKVKAEKKVVILDAGHGGIDPGKVGINDALEKDINLAIVKKVQKQLEKCGIEVVMTRKDDSILAEEGAQNKKIQDMKARVKLINDTAPDMVVSIHQNSYQDPAIHGAQVFYYTHSTQGKTLAETMQKALLSADPENTRQAKADSTYYFLKRTEVPTIIVECGFLSNPEEAGRLVTEEYQKEMAKAVVKGIQDCLELSPQS